MGDSKYTFLPVNTVIIFGVDSHRACAPRTMLANA